MRVFEFVVALIVGAFLLIVLKILGVVLKIAIIAALIGMVAGFAVTRAFRSK